MIGIIGAGISGLTTAYYLQKNNLPYRLFEATDRPGGFIQTKKSGKYLLELGPNSILVDEALEAFIDDVGLSSSTQAPNAVSKNRFIFRKGKYRKLPASPLGLISNNFFSFATKKAIYREMKKPAQKLQQETLSHFFARRFSPEVVDYALNPFVSGIYAGNPDELLVEKTFPFLQEYEQQYGSVIKGFMKNKTAGRKTSLSFTEGMEAFPRAIAEKLENISYHTAVQSITRSDDQYILHTSQGDYSVNSLIISTPSFTMYEFLKDLFPQESESLLKISYPPMIVVHSAYKRTSVAHPLNGFGGLNPKVEDLYTAGSIWSSSVFSGRCPEDEVLFTTFVGGSQYTANTRQTELVTLGKVHQELAHHYQIKGNPIFQQMYKWEKTIPQYDLDILSAHRFAENLEKEQIFVCANWKDGISLADCIRKAKKLAEQLAENEQVRI